MRETDNLASTPALDLDGLERLLEEYKNLDAELMVAIENRADTYEMWSAQDRAKDKLRRALVNAAPALIAAAREREELRAVVRDLVQLTEEQSGHLEPEGCKFSALACIDGVHVAECPVSVARTLLDRPSAGAAEG